MMLQKTFVSSSAVVEILVCSDAGVILASSNPEQKGRVYQPLPDLLLWTQRSFWERLVEVLTTNHEFVRVVPLGPQGQKDPILNIRVVVSSVFIRRAFEPQVRDLIWSAVLFIAASIILAYLFSNRILRSLDRLGRQIDLLATGQFADKPPPRPEGEAKEFADMQSKLDTLGQRFRGARDDVVQLRANIDTMLERLDEAVLLFDSRRRIQRANGAAEKLLSMPREGMLAMTLDELFPAFTPVGSVIRRAMLNSQPVRDAALTLERERASPVRVLVNVDLLDDNVLLTLQDTETRRQLRSQLDISTRLAAISRLTGGVAHEIKNPLNAMALHLEILRSKLERGDEVDNEVSVIGGEIARLDRVVKTFLDFTRPVELDLADIDLAALATQVAGLVEPEARKVGVSIQLDADEPAMVRGDRDLLKQAVLNVVNNGIEAMPEGGALEISVSRESGAGPGEVVLRVCDHGVGIPDSVRDRIFSLYFTTKPRGSGIGLAMTFRIVQLHNASIDFQTQRGAGTTFRMRFPAADLPAPRVPDAAEANGDLAEVRA
jgi:signal transduction histidine kinase